jgi:HD-like signal output (HDOD) protein
MESSDVIRSILDRASNSGDLPILNASIAQVRQVSSDPDAHAMKLAETILRDANLTTRILRIANSPSYNRGTGRIATVSRAVVLLGFETIRNLCLTVKLIEAFQVEHPAIGMHQMLARAYFTAGFVRDLAVRCGIRDAEETYLCGLLHNLGEIAVAYFAPQQFNVMTALQKKNEMTWTETQRLILGASIEDVGQQIATSWKFAPKLVATMAPYQTANTRLVRNRDELSHALTALSGDVIGKLYVEHHTTNQSLRETFHSLSEIVGTTTQQIEQDLTNSFQASCGLAAEYGLPAHILQPILRPTEDDLLSRLAREFGFYATRPQLA